MLCNMYSDVDTYLNMLTIFKVIPVSTMAKQPNKSTILITYTADTDNETIQKYIIQYDKCETVEYKIIQFLSPSHLQSLDFLKYKL